MCFVGRFLLAIRPVWAAGKIEWGFGDGAFCERPGPWRVLLIRVKG